MSDIDKIGWEQTITRRDLVTRYAPPRLLEGQPTEVWIDWLQRASKGLHDAVVSLSAEMSEYEGGPYVTGWSDPLAAGDIP